MAEIGAVQGGSASAATTQKTGNIVSKDDFFKMLVAQLKNQDPLKPLDATAFTAQLAEFSSLEKLENVNVSLTSLLDQQTLSQRLQAATLTGKYAVADAEASSSFIAAGGPVELRYELPADAQKVFVTIYDEKGRAVDMLEERNQGSGAHVLTWPNSSAKKGSFTYLVSAFDEAGRDVKAAALISGPVSGVSFRDGRVYLTINSRDIAIEKLKSISETAS